jgi:hypothetical protein
VIDVVADTGGSNEEESVLTTLTTGISNFYSRVISNALAGKLGDTDYSDVYKSKNSAVSTTGDDDVDTASHEKSKAQKGDKVGTSSAAGYSKMIITSSGNTSSYKGKFDGYAIIYDKLGRIRVLKDYKEVKPAIDSFKKTDVYRNLKADYPDMARDVLTDYSTNYKNSYKWKIPKGKSSKQYIQSKIAGYPKENSIVVTGRGKSATNTSISLKKKSTGSIPSGNITNLDNSLKRVAGGDAGARGGRGTNTVKPVQNNKISSEAIRKYVTTTAASNTNEILINAVNILADIAMSTSDSSTKLGALESIKSLAGNTVNNYYAVTGNKAKLVDSKTSSGSPATANKKDISTAAAIARGGF